jgi:hypothetical protein
MMAWLSKKSRRENATRRLVRDREQLAALSPGGSADRPIAVASAAVVEVRARATPCPQCAGELRVREHTAPPRGCVKSA